MNSSIKIKESQQINKKLKFVLGKVEKLEDENKKLKVKLTEKHKAQVIQFKEEAKKVKESTKQKFKLIKENKKLKKKANNEPIESHAIQTLFKVDLVRKIKFDGKEEWMPEVGYFHGDKKEIKFKASNKVAEVKKYEEGEAMRIKNFFTDSDTQFVKATVQKTYIDRIHDVSFDGLVYMNMFGDEHPMSIPRIGANYTDFDEMCVPMGLLKHLNNPHKPKENRIQSMTLEAIVEILNECPAKCAGEYEQVNELRSGSMSYGEYQQMLEYERQGKLSDEEQQIFFRKKLQMGYNAKQVLYLCSHEKVRIRAYCLDHRERVIASNAQDIPDNKRNKKIPNLVFMAWNNHFYVIDDIDVKESVAHTYQARNIGCKRKIAKDDDEDIDKERNKNEKRLTQDERHLDHIPDDFQDYIHCVIYIENEKNLVNDFFYDEVKRGIIHTKGLKVKAQEVLAFEYTSTRTLLIYKPQYTEIKSICLKLNQMYNENKEDDNPLKGFDERIYNVENHNIHSLALSYYERNYGHYLSFMNTEGNEVMNSPLNSAFNEYWKRPENMENSRLHQYDYSKHYTSCLLNSELGFSVYSPLDEIEPFISCFVPDENGENTIEPDELQEGFYYVETDNYFPLKGNGWYNGEPLREYIEDGIISIHDIKYKYLPSRTLNKDHFKMFVNDVFELFGEKSAKMALNGFIGLLRKTSGKSSLSYFTNSKIELCCHYNDFIKQGYDLSQIPVNYIEDETGEIVAYHIMDEKTYPLPKSNIPIYRKIYDMSALYLWRLVKRVGSMENVLGIHTDTIYFQDGNKLQEDGIKIGGIRKVGDAPWEHIKLVERQVTRDYKYSKNVSVTNIQGDELLSIDKGCMIKGKAGTGKSYIINNKLIPYLEENNINYAICASTWKASKKIKGVTVHSLFGIDPTRPTINISTCMALHRKGIRHLIIDEISMLQEHIWGILHQIKDICGFVFYIVGDYNQLPPVNEEDVYTKFESSHLVQHICDYRKLMLTENKRLKEGEFIFYQELDNVLEGKGINEALYGREECEFAIAYHNVVVDKHNMKYMLKNAEKAGSYEVLEGGKQTLYLFKGLKVIATVTFKDYVNCEDFVVESYDKKNIILKSPIDNMCIEVPRKDFIKNFKPYYAITVHKAQGDTFDFPFTIYEYKTLQKKGNNFLYTALSRSTSIKHINIIDYCPSGKMGYIYMYEFENGKKYIGSTFNEIERKKQHLESQEKDKFHTQLRSGMPYTYSIIKSVDVSDDDELRKREAYYISLHNAVENGYNSKSI